jgi:hypothetical protein
MPRHLLRVSLLALVIAAPAFAQAPTPTAPATLPNVNAIPEDADCVTRLTGAAQQGESQRAAGAQEIVDNQPKFTEMNCLDDMLSGAGIDLFGIGIDMNAVLARLKGQACAAAGNLLSAAKSQSQGCGIYASGWNMGLPGYGTGQLCRSMYVGGGGGDIFGAGTRRPSTGFGQVFGKTPEFLKR